MGTRTWLDRLNAHDLADARVFAFWGVERPGRAISVKGGAL